MVGIEAPSTCTLSEKLTSVVHVLKSVAADIFLAMGKTFQIASSFSYPRQDLLEAA